MKILALLGLLLLAGCATFDAQPPRVEVQGPQKAPPLNKYQFEINFYGNLESLQKECGPKSGGCAEIYVNPCRLHLLKQDWTAFIHEGNHCYFGIWHD